MSASWRGSDRKSTRLNSSHGSISYAVFCLKKKKGAMWMHGVPLKMLSLYWMGNEFGSKMPEGVRVLPVSIPVGTHPLHAVGLAWAGKYRQDGSIEVTYFRDGATSEGDVH